QPNAGNIRVAIGDGLRTYLNQAYGRHKRAEKPQPSNGQKRMMSRQNESAPGGETQNSDGQKHKRESPVILKWVEDAQFGRPNRLGKITQIGNQGVGDSGRDRKTL